MKAYKVEILIIDHDNVGMYGIMDELEDANYPNDCISPYVIRINGAEIGEWHDDHPLNDKETMMEEYNRLFGSN